MPKQPDTQQSARFIEAARQLGADEDEAAFKAKLAQIARQKPVDSPVPDAVKAAPIPRRPSK